MAYEFWENYVLQLNCSQSYVQYRPRALQHYTRVSRMEIRHIAHKFHEEKTRETLV